MSFQKVAALAEEFAIKYKDSKNIDTSNADDEADAIDEKIWNRAKKVVKNYWKGYDEPWAVVYDVYRKMGGKPKKKSKQKSSS